ncbi:MAG: serine protease [Planctomycetes bacterium]|nr:serine protease [Planctomycetota bacterium]
MKPAIAVLLVFLAAGGFAESGIPEAKLTTLKSATAFILVSSNGTPVASGSGFVMRVAAGAGYLATNAHVVAGVRGRTVQAIFNSGTASELTLPGEVVAEDPDRDLALIKIVGAKLPTPIALGALPKLRETMPVFVLGFPFGDLLATSRNHSSMTITTGTVTSLRLDDFKNLSVVQIDADINSGNSGGPVVDSSGNLIGIATAKLTGTNIGLAVPSTELSALLKGRLHRMSYVPKSQKDSTVTYAVEATLIDPLAQVKGLSLFLMPFDAAMAGPFPPDKDGKFVQLSPKMREYRLKIESGKGTADVVLDIAKGNRFLVQWRTSLSDGPSTWCQPDIVTLAGAGAGTGGGAVLDPEFAKRNGGKDAKTEGPLVPMAPVATGPSISFPGDRPETRTPLPALIEDIAVADDGNLLVLKIKGINGLMVYDAEKMAIARTINLPSDNFQFGAGGKTVMVFFPENGLLQTLNLATGEKIKTKPSPIPGVVQNITMGRGRDDLALLRIAKGTGELDFSTCYFIKTADLTAIGAEAKPLTLQIRNGCYRDLDHFRCDGTMSLISEWATSHSPQGVGIFSGRAGRYTNAYEHESQGSLLAGDDGRLYTSSGCIYDATLKKGAEIRGCMLYPGIGGSLFLALNSSSGAFTVYPSGKSTPIGPAGGFPGWTIPEPGRTDARNDPWAKNDFTFDKHVVFDPRHGRLLIVPLSDDAIIARCFNLKSILAASGVDYLFVVSAPDLQPGKGKAWSYQIEAISSAGDVSYEMQVSPTGMAITPSGAMTWKVPASGNPQESVVVVVKDKSGEQTFHSFTIYPQ